MDQIIVNCQTGQTEARPMTAQETAALQRAQAEAQASDALRTRAGQQRQQDINAVLATMPTPEARDALRRLLAP